MAAKAEPLREPSTEKHLADFVNRVYRDAKERESKNMGGIVGIELHYGPDGRLQKWRFRPEEWHG